MRLAAAITTPVTNAAMQVNSSISLRTRAMATPQRLERGQEYPHTREPNSEPHYLVPQSSNRTRAGISAQAIQAISHLAAGGRGHWGPLQGLARLRRGERLAGDMSGSGQHDQAPIEWPAATRGESRCGVEVGRSLRFSRAG
jgi:hypothetical protein